VDAETGLRALDTLREHPVDLMPLDIMSPQIDLHTEVEAYLYATLSADMMMEE
jgi:CheY-like chemotaxis protein